MFVSDTTEFECLIGTASDKLSYSILIALIYLFKAKIWIG